MAGWAEGRTGGTPGASHDIFLNGTWQSLASAVTYSVSATGGGADLAGTIMIAATGARTTILGTAALSLYAYGVP